MWPLIKVWVNSALNVKASSVDKARTIVPHDWVESLQTKARVSSDFDG